MTKISEISTVRALPGFIVILLSAHQPIYANNFNDEGISFEDRSALLEFRRAGGEGLGGAAWLDFDKDGDLDLFLTNGRDNNRRDGTFKDIAMRAGILRTGQGTEWSAAMGDINNDGYLDLFIRSPGHIPFVRAFGQGQSHPNKLFLNNGDLTFTDISRSAGIEGLYVDEASGRIVSDGACAVGFSDYNRDNLVDIFVANCNAFNLDHRMTGTILFRETPFNLFRNNGDQTFTDVASEANLDILGFWMALAFGDFNNDGNIDVFATSTGTVPEVEFPHALMRNNGDGTFDNIAGKELAENPFSWGATAADFDNDGDLDLFKAGSLPVFGWIDSLASPGEVFRNDGDAGFVRDFDATDIDLSADNVTGVAQGDFNGDGFPDIVVIRSAFQLNFPIFDFIFDLPNGQPVLLQNKGNNNGWLTVRPVGTESNRMGIGARIEVFTPGHSLSERQVRKVRAGGNFLSSESPWPTFGLGPSAGDSSITVSWPSGLVEVFPSVSPGQIYDVVEGSGNRQDNQ